MTGEEKAESAMTNRAPDVLPRYIGELDGYPMVEVTELDVTQETKVGNLIMLSPQEYQRVVTDLFLQDLEQELKERIAAAVKRSLKTGN